MINKPLSELSRKDIYCRLKFMHLFNTRRRILNIAALSEVVISFDTLSLCEDQNDAYLFNGDRILTIAALSEVVISFDALSLCRKSKAYLFNGNIKLI